MVIIIKVCKNQLLTSHIYYQNSIAFSTSIIKFCGKSPPKLLFGGLGIISLVDPKTCDSSWLHKVTMALYIFLIKASESTSAKKL